MLSYPWALAHSRLTLELKVGVESVIGGGWHHDEGALRWLVEGVVGRHVITLVRRLLVPLIWQNL